MGPSDSHLGPLPQGAVEGQRLPLLGGSPVLRRALSSRAVPTTPASHPEAQRFSFFQVRRPSPHYGRVGTRNYTFEACSGFTRVTAREFASPPFEDSCPGGLTTPVTLRPSARSYEAAPPIASTGLSPVRTRHLCTAHHNDDAVKVGARRLSADSAMAADGQAGEGGSRRRAWSVRHDGGIRPPRSTSPGRDRQHRMITQVFAQASGHSTAELIPEESGRGTSVPP
jgi:hypothetical protein